MITLNKLLSKLEAMICKLLVVDNIAYIKIAKRHDLLRIGTEYGGWVVAGGLLDTQSICYCVGCGEDISFDLGLIEKYNCEIYAYDPTPRAKQYVKNCIKNVSNYHFYEYGLWDENTVLKLYAPKNPKHVSHSALNLQKTDTHIKVDVKNLSTIMGMNNHKMVNVLKIDIEGAEYKVINSIISDQIKIEQLCVEFDEWNNPIDKKYKKRIHSSIKKLIEYGYEIVSCDYNGNYTFLYNK